MGLSGDIFFYGVKPYLYLSKTSYLPVNNRTERRFSSCLYFAVLFILQGGS